MIAVLSLVDLSGASEPTDVRMIFGNLLHRLRSRQVIEPAISDVAKVDSTSPEPSQRKCRPHIAAVRIDAPKLQHRRMNAGEELH